MEEIIDELRVLCCVGTWGMGGMFYVNYKGGAGRIPRPHSALRVRL